MNIRLALPTLLLSVASLAPAQSTVPVTPTPPLTPPPVKMGLWQSSVTINMSGMPNMPSGAGSTTHVNQSCMTPDNWKDAFRNMQQRRQQMSANCTTTNYSQDAHQLTLDMSCTSEQGMNTNMHIQMFLDNDSAMHGSATTKISGAAFPQGMVVNSTISSKFLSSDCGDVKPGEGKAVQQ